MMKNQRLILTIILFLPLYGLSQCYTAPALPPCTGSEPLVMPDETINQGSTKWYYGSVATYNSLTMKGGVLVVCGDLSIDKFYMDSGTIYIHPGTRFVVGSGIGAGLILKGNSAIYNYGTCEIQRNLSLDNGWASDAKPNMVVNATATSIFRMSNQYLVVNNPDSWFVNNGVAEFWGTILEPTSSPGSICLGNGSVTNMAVLINKVGNTYTVPVGSACVQVRQFSQFFAALTAESGLRACVSTGHNSDSGCIPFGCMPNNWGAATVLGGCTDCASFAVLQVSLSKLVLQKEFNGYHRLSWRMEHGHTNGLFRILRSADGTRYISIDSFQVASLSTPYFSTLDSTPLPGDNYYMIQYVDPENRHVVNSKSVRTFSESFRGFRIFPVPFDQNLTIQYDPHNIPEQIMLTDMSGRNIPLRWYRRPQQQQICIDLLEPLTGDLYLIHIRTAHSIIAKTLLRN